MGGLPGTRSRGHVRGHVRPSRPRCSTRTPPSGENGLFHRSPHQLITSSSHHFSSLTQRSPRNGRWDCIICHSTHAHAMPTRTFACLIAAEGSFACHVMWRRGASCTRPRRLMAAQERLSAWNFRVPLSSRFPSHHICGSLIRSWGIKGRFAALGCTSADLLIPASTFQTNQSGSKRKHVTNTPH